MASKPSAKRAGKEPARYVLVDIGYQTAEHWVKAKVIRSEIHAGLFGGSTATLRVQLPDGKVNEVRNWIDYDTRPIGLERIINRLLNPKPKNTPRAAKTIIHVNQHHVDL